MSEENTCEQMQMQVYVETVLKQTEALTAGTTLIVQQMYRLKKLERLAREQDRLLVRVSPDLKFPGSALADDLHKEFKQLEEEYR